MEHAAWCNEVSVSCWLTVTPYSCHWALAVSPCPSESVCTLSLNFKTFLSCCHCHLYSHSCHVVVVVVVGCTELCVYVTAQHVHCNNRKNERVLVPVATRLRKSPTVLRRSREVSQRASMAVRGGGPTTPSQTAPQSQRVTQSQRASPQSPSHSKPQQRSKTSQLERRSVWQMWRR